MTAVKDVLREVRREARRHMAAEFYAVLYRGVPEFRRRWSPDRVKALALRLARRVVPVEKGRD